MGAMSGEFMSKRTPLERHFRVICDAIFSGRLPDAAIEWPIVELSKTTITIGSGESTSWKSARTVRVNGKQTARKTGYGCENINLPPCLAKAGTNGHIEVFVQVPEFIPT